MVTVQKTSKDKARWPGSCAAWFQRRGPLSWRRVLHCTVSGCRGLAVLAVAFCTVFSVRAESRALLWLGGQAGSTTRLLDPATNVISAAIGEQGILVLEANGGVSLAERKEGSHQFDPPATATKAVAVSALGNFAGALRSDGRVVIWGSSSRTPPAGLSNVVALAVGGDNTLALRADGTVASWGIDTSSGGNTVPPGLHDVATISTSWTYNNSLVLRTDGTVASWGARSAAANLIPSAATNVVAIAAGLEENFALRADGTVVGWGNGQDNHYRPDGPSPFFPFAGITNIVDIAAGPSHVLALTSDGRVLDYGGQDLGITNALYVTPVDARGFLVLTGDGMPLVVNEPPDSAGFSGERLRLIGKVGGARPLKLQWTKDGMPIPGATNAALLINNARGTDAGSYQLTVSNAHGTASSRIAKLNITESAPVVRRIAIEPTTHTPFIGGTATLLAEVTGSVPMSFQWLFGSAPIIGATNAALLLENLRRDQSGNYSLTVSNALGTTTSAALNLNVSGLVIWGNEIIKNRGVPEAATNLAAVSTWEAHTIALRADGTVVVWGNGTDYPGLAPPPGLNNVVAVAAGPGYNLALKADGRLTGWGWNFAALNIPTALSNIVGIAAGHQYCLAVRADGALLAFGNNARARQVAAGGVDRVIAVAAYLGYGIALLSDGTVLNVGDETLLGPVPADLADAVAIALGRSNAQAVRADGTVIQWGTIYDVNLLPQSADLHDAIALANGGDHVLALRANGTVVGWGADGFQQATVPADLNEVAAIAAGYTHSMAIVDSGPPRIFQQPRSFDGIIGANARLVVSAIGGQPLRYQWRVNGLDLLEATNSVLALDGLSFFDDAEYDVVVSNERGSVTSELAGITVRVSPPFNVKLQVEPATGAALLGGSALFSAHAEGTQPFAYQWLHHGQPISNSRAAELRLNNLAYADAGEYAVVVANPFGTSTSPPVRLTVVELAAWGGNFDSQLEVPPSATNVVSVYAGGFHGVALRADGTVVVWGNRPKDGGMLSGGTLQPPAGLNNVVGVAAGNYFNVALKGDGRLAGWGDNSFGQLNGLSSLSNVVAVAAGHAHTLALRADGTVVGVGGNYDGQLNLPANLDDAIAIAASSTISLILRSDGSVIQAGDTYYWGDFLPPPPPPEATNIIAMAAGQYHALALRSDGAVIEWGYRRNDEIARPSALTGVVAIAAGAHHDLALRADGSLTAWGANWLGQAVVPGSLSRLAGFSAGYAHSLALVGGGAPRIVQQPLSFTAVSGRNARLIASASGALPLYYQWRQNGFAITGATRPVLALDNLSFFDAANYDVIVSNALGSSTSRVATISVTFQPPSNAVIHMEPTNGVAFLGGSASMTSTSSGSPPFGYQWRFQDRFVLSARGSTLRLEGLTFADSGSYSVAVANPFGSSTSAPVQLSIVQVAAWGGRNAGSDNRVFEVPPSVTNVVAVSAGRWHVLALRPDGSVIGWGDSDSGQLAIPASATNLTSVVAGGEFSLGLRRDGSVLVWGDVGSHVFGLRNFPPGLSNVVQLAATYSWALALKADGTVAQWGTYIGGYMKPPPPGLTNVIQISVGERHALGLLRDGTVVAWGGNDLGQLNVPSGLSNVVAIAAGSDNFNMALREDGTVIEWGRDATAPPPEAINLVAIAGGLGHRIGLRDDGRVISWGFENGNAGQTRVPPDLPPVIAIAAAGDASFGVIPASGEPHLARQPRQQTLFTGQRLRLEASVFPGAEPVSYRWFQNGAELPFQTNAVLEILSATIADAGRYFLRASNAFGTDTSREAEVIVVEQAPLIVAQPVDVMTYLGGFASFSVAATGTVPLMFRWFFNDAPLPGATNASLVFQQVSGTNAGVYHVVISNGLGTAISRSVELRLTPAIILAQTEVPVNSSGRFTFKVGVSEPLAREVRLQFVYWHDTPWRGAAVREAFAVVAPGAIEQCVAIQDAALAQALADGFSGVLQLVVADGAMVASPAEAVFRVASVGDLMCDTVSIEPPRFVPRGLQKRPDGAVELIFSADTHRPFSVQASTDLQNWWTVTGVFAVDPVGGHIWFLDRDASNAPMRFYRIHGE